jgi:AraC family transcriptional regulator
VELLPSALIAGERGAFESAGAPLACLTVHAAGRIGQTIALDGRAARRGLVPGDIDLIPAGTRIAGDDEGAYAMLILALPGEALARAFDAQGVRAARPEPWLGVRDEAIARLAWALHRENAGGDALYRACLGDELLTRLVRRLAPAARRADPKARALSGERLRRVLDFIDGNLDRPFTVDDLAERAGLGLTTFKAAFRLALNTPVHGYVVRRRSERARLFLLAGELAPSQIALEAGFSHQTHMARWLRRLYGVAPSDLGRRRRPLVGPRRRRLLPGEA